MDNESTTTTENKQITAIFTVAIAAAEVIRELGEIPSGHLYARMMDKLSCHQYQQIIDMLKKAGVVEETPAHLLRWIGTPKQPREAGRDAKKIS